MNSRETVNMRVVQIAREWTGTPYLHQGSTKGLGCDCLGLIRGIWRELFGSEPEVVPAYASSWAEVSSSERLLEAAQRNLISRPVNEMVPGNVIVWRMRRNAIVKHTGVLTAPNKFIHAYEGSQVVENHMSDFWLRRIAGVFEFPDEYVVN